MGISAWVGLLVPIVMAVLVTYVFAWGCFSPSTVAPAFLCA